MDLNPILTEIHGLSPAAKSALGMAGHTLPPTENTGPGMITPQMKADVAPQDAGPAPSIGGMQMPSGPMPMGMAAPPKAVPSRLGLDQQELGRKIDTGSGISQISSRIQGTGFGQNHPMAGKILGGAAQGLATIGDIGLSAVEPSIAMNLPGTEYHHQLRVNQDNKQVKEDEAAQESEALQGAQKANTAHLAEETTEMPGKAADEHDQSQATIGNIESEQENRDHPQPNLAAGHAYAVDKAIKEGRDPSTDPLVMHYEKAIQSTVPGFNKPVEAPKTTDIEGPDHKVHTMGFDAKTGKFDVDEGISGFKPATVNVNAGEAALDRETKQFGTSHQKAVTDANTQLEKIADARNMINGNAESQALGVPKVLTALVSGAGSGVRITQPELNAIAKARGIGGDVEGTLNSLSGKGKLTKEQQQQLTGILDDVKNRILQKQAIASEALDRINGASTRQEIIQADKDARKRLGDIERGSGSGPKMMRALDPNGVLHEAPEGTPLPKGWKAQ